MKNVVSLVLVLLFVGCSVGPSYEPPQILFQNRFLTTSDNNFEISEPTLEWWKAFNDEELVRLIEAARNDNHDIKVAISRLKEARALKSEAWLDFVPTIRSENYYSRNQLSEARAPLLSREQRDSELYSAGFDATWELDIWGRVRRQNESNNAQVEATQAGLDDVLLSIEAEVAKNYFQLRGYQEQLVVANRNATNQEKTLSLTQQLLDAGEVTEFDTSRAKAQLSLTRAQIPRLEAARDATLYQLTTLLGKQPHELSLSNAVTVPTQAIKINIGDPTSLIKARPDVRIAERSLASAVAAIGVATADFFPRIVANGNFALESSISPRHFSGSGAESWGFGPSISWAFLDMGRVIARKNAADARAEAAIEQYKRAVLFALQDTETSLSSVAKNKEQVAFLSDAVDATRKSVEIAQERYKAGVADFLSVLDVEKNALETELRLVEAKTNAAISIIALNKALGRGSFSVE